MESLHILENNWSLWFHKINDHDYTLNGYNKIYKINSIEYFIKLFREINNFSAGMFFFMKEDIPPMWENEENCNGGYWSFKVLKKNINSLWFNLCTILISNNCLKNQEDHKYINGLSLSPKINNCIIKIWFSKIETDINIFNINYLKEKLDDINFDEARFVKHSK